ncbi:tryptophan synthase beta subunit-like PLP-dependent enzyme [Aspergillus karnatakaensis]|uniref:1-aminocyclopropane-1-carboxylate deaminase/D-cysteine desulfhydrase n=1 Tax=Aspergillus karnatakaensis TaxID=1810916 RepID=UPI003CCDC6AC
MSRKLPLPLPLPEPLASLPRSNLLYPFSSPIHPLQTLSSTAAAAADRKRKTKITIHAKREDHSSPLACAGNKYRKLEYMIPDILSPSPRYGAGIGGELPASLSTSRPGPGSGSETDKDPSQDQSRITTLVTEGAIQSNHTVQVASVASKLGLESVVLLHKATGGGLAASSDKNSFLRTGNVQIVKLLGADVRILEPPSPPKTGDDYVQDVLTELRRSGKNPYWIPSGASLHPLGGLGYARCAFEIVEQEKDLPAPQSQSEGSRKEDRTRVASRFDYIFVACGSGSTLAGLIAGFKLHEKTNPDLPANTNSNHRPRPRRIIGILTSPTARKAYHEERILRFARAAGAQIGLDPEKDITADDVILDDRFTGTRYGVLDRETREALKLFAEGEEVLLDPVYTAKVGRGVLHWVNGGEIERDVASFQGQGKGEGRGEEEVNVLVIHTGGQSALGAYADV